MDPRQEIAALEQIIDELMDTIQAMIQSGEIIDSELQNQLADIIEDSTNRIIELQEQERPEDSIGTHPIPTGADLLWILAGGQEDAFVNYLRTYPNAELNQLLQNPGLLAHTIEHLQRTIPQQQPQSADGIEHAPLNSSNIYGFRYDPKTKRLLVRFQSGSVYSYDNVPNGIFQVFQQGAVPSRTNGRNQYGRWWIGKIPSLGSSFYQLIRNGGYSYTRLS